ncbi:hypothetical protein [Orenia marismortui]|uniref:hypothetical protein n=1 Tax=Orenia marismortui TaxID=46469 RepID=UPI00035F4083|nr:hypothetical protein [Orenia marismortui]
MEISEILEKQLKGLCEIQSKAIENLKDNKASQMDVEILEFSNKLIGEKMDQIQNAKHMY